MNRFPDLSPDQRAVLSLLARQGKSYAQVAALLSIPQEAVRDRALGAVIALVGEEPSLTDAQCQEISDYLLGQQNLSTATSTYLQTLEAARDWAEDLRAGLEEILPGELPEIPDQHERARSTRQEVTEQPFAAVTVSELSHSDDTSAPAEEGSPLPVSRRGGAILLGAILVVVVVAVVLIVNNGSGSGKATSSNTASTHSATTTAQGSSSSPGSLEIDNQINIDSPEASSKAKGVVYVVSEGSQRAFYLVAEGLQPSKGFLYVAWLYNSKGEAKVLGKAPTVGSDGRLRGVASLPSDASKYHRFILARQTSEHTSEPGPIVLSGSFSLHSGHPPRVLSGNSPIEGSG